jgi:hypothetical protein
MLRYPPSVYAFQNLISREGLNRFGIAVKIKKPNPSKK